MDRLFRVASRDEWSDKASVRSCEACSKSFTLLTKPAHCRACGRLMCPSCLERQLTLPGHPGTAPVPVCHSCAVGISKAQSDAESAYHQRHSVMEVLSAQQTETKELLEVSSSLRVENERLVELIEKLQTEGSELRKKNRALEIAAEASTVAARLEPTTNTAQHSSDKVPLATSSGTEPSPLSPSSSHCADNEAAALAAELCKKQKLLDVREATLQQALKKVSADADRLAGQRQQLHETERRMRGELAKRFDAIVEDESRRLQDVHLEELASFGKQFAEWFGAARRDLQAEREKGAQEETEKTQADALRRQLSESQRELAEAREAHRVSEAKLRQRLDDDTSVLRAAAAVKERQMTKELDALRRAIEEERRQMQEEQTLLKEQYKQQEERQGPCVSVDTREDDGVAKKLRRELSSALRLARDFEERANQHALEVVALKRAAGSLESEMTELRERLTRTEKALVRANGIERRLTRELHEKGSSRSVHLTAPHSASDNSGDMINNNHNNNSDNNSEKNPFVKFAEDALLCAGAYADGCVRLFGEAIEQRFSAGANALEAEWAKRHELTRRNTLALEETTASIKTFQNVLKARKGEMARVEEGLRARERELSGHSVRLVKLSRALQTVARRLREYGTAAECAQTEREIEIDLGMDCQETEKRRVSLKVQGD